MTPYHLYLTLTLVLLLPAFVLVFFSGFFGLFWMFAITLAFAFIDNFVHINATTLAILGALVPISFLIDFLSGVIGAKLGGASKRSLFSGFVGALIGTFVIPVPIVGTMAGLFVGIAIGELHSRHSKKRALRAATYGVLGTLTGALLNVVVAFAYLVIFAWMAW